VCRTNAPVLRRFFEGTDTRRVWREDRRELGSRSFARKLAGRVRGRRTPVG